MAIYDIFKMRTLKQFAGFQEVFKAPQYLPEFFQQNLVDPHRVVKAFLDDPQAHIRVFYYQYLKLCFQISSPKSEELVQKIEELINNPNFKFYFYQEDDQSIFNDNQAKAFITQFFGQLSSAQCTILEALNLYPIMDVIMVHFFRTLIILMDKSQSLDNFIPRDELLSFLCPFFGIDVQIHDSCIKYVDSDVFVYDQNERAVFMAFMSDAEENQGDRQVNSQQIIDQYSQQNVDFAPQSTVSQAVEQKKAVHDPPPVLQPKPQLEVEEKRPNRLQAKESYIASEWNDYTIDPSVTKLADKGTALKGSEHQIEEKVISNAKTTLTSVNNKPLVFVETNSISSGSESKNIQDNISSFQSQNIYGPVDYLAKSNPVSKPLPNPTVAVPYIPSDTNLQSPTNSKFFSSNQYPNQEVPTKDKSGFSQQNQYTSSTASYQNHLTSETLPSSKPVPSYEVSKAQDHKYQPKFEAPLYNPQPQIYSTVTSTSKVESSLYNPKPQTSPKAANYDLYGGAPDFSAKVQYNSTQVTGGKKRVFGLNVSDEFTNSLTIKKMAEPYKSNVTNIKSRARQFRNSLTTYIK